MMFGVDSSSIEVIPNGITIERPPRYCTSQVKISWLWLAMMSIKISQRC